MPFGHWLAFFGLIQIDRYLLLSGAVGEGMRDIPTVMTGQELLDKAFRRVKKVKIMDQKGLAKAKAEAAGKLSAISNTLTATLHKYVRKFPSLDQVHPFELEIIDVTIGVDRLKHSLGAIDWARKTIDSIHRSELKVIKNAENGQVASAALNSAYGRISGVVNRVSKDLEFLNEARDKLKTLPDINSEEPVVVVAGCPNVGKSQLVTCISSGKPEIASYPFTTKGVSIGHLHIDYDRIQIMDTPGLLDRELEKRNAIELQAIAALEHLADVLLFVFDPSETCGYSMEAQENLLADLRNRFSSKPIIVVCNKSDLAKSDLGLPISAKEGTGIESLLDEIKKAFS